MATFTNDLRLKEIGTGDESGTWGTSTNTNLSLIADAFSLGTKQMAADANETFTMPDASADGTRSLYLKITSAVSLTATRTVTLGPNTVSKVWIIENATTGSQSIAIAQGSGATVTIATGTKVMVVTDGAGGGAAVFSANPTTTSGTVTSVAATVPSLLSIAGSPITSSGTLAFTYSGTALPVANGGTGITSLGAGVATFLGTPSSANLAAAVTDETGSGALVFGTSPTLSGPTFTAYRETVTIATVSASTHNIDLSISNVFKFTLGNNVTFSFTNPPSAGTLASVTVILIQDGSGNRTATFTGAQYSDGLPPTLSTGAGDKDVLTFFTVDGGSPYYGTFAMADVS